MFFTRGVAVLATALLGATAALALPPVPATVKPNPPGLERPKHLGKEWPRLNIDEKLYSLRFTDMRDNYREAAAMATIERTSAYPELHEQFGLLMGYDEVPAEYYGKKPPELYQQPFTDHAACLTGATGLIDMPTGFTQPRGTMHASLIYTSSKVTGAEYFPIIYTKTKNTDLRAAFTYGVRDDIEVTLVTSMLDRDINYTNGAHAVDSGLFLVGGGAKLSFPTIVDRWQIAFGGMYTVYGQRDRDYLRITEDYDNMANLYMTGSTDSRLFNAHFMYKYVMYDYRSDIVAPTGSIGGDPATGYGPGQTHWGVLGLGFEYKPSRRLSFINEFTHHGPLDFTTRSEKAWNFAVQTRMEKMDLKVYTRQMNHVDYNEVGLISTFRF